MILKICVILKPSWNLTLTNFLMFHVAIWNIRPNWSDQTLSDLQAPWRSVECAIGFLYPSPSSPRHFQIRWTFAKDYDRHMWRMGSRCPCTIWIEISTTCKCKTSPGWTPTVFTPPSPPPWGCQSRLPHCRSACVEPTWPGRLAFNFHFLTFR